jgi:hypothetical protein
MFLGSSFIPKPFAFWMGYILAFFSLFFLLHLKRLNMFQPMTWTWYFQVMYNSYLVSEGTILKQIINFIAWKSHNAHNKDHYIGYNKEEIKRYNINPCHVNMKLLGGWGAMHIGDKKNCLCTSPNSIELIKALDYMQSTTQ